MDLGRAQTFRPKHPPYFIITLKKRKNTVDIIIIKCTTIIGCFTILG